MVMVHAHVQWGLRLQRDTASPLTSLYARTWAKMNTTSENHLNNLYRDHIICRNHHLQASVVQQYGCVPSARLPSEIPTANTQHQFAPESSQGQNTDISNRGKTKWTKEELKPYTYTHLKNGISLYLLFFNCSFYYVPWTHVNADTYISIKSFLIVA